MRFTAARAPTPAELAAKAVVAKVTTDRCESCEDDERLLQSFFRDAAEALGEHGQVLITEAVAIDAVGQGRPGGLSGPVVAG